VLANLGEPDETLASFLLLHYERNSAPAELAVNRELPDMPAVSAALMQRFGQSLRLWQPDRGAAQRWVAMSAENAALALRMHGARLATAEESMHELAQALGMTMPLRRVECFDISHTAGEGAVASCVVFGPEGAEKRNYRRFNIEGITPGDDYAALEQALTRHGRRKLQGESPVPELLLIDGGPAQVRAATKGLAAAECSGSRVLGISKGADRRAGQEQLHWADNAAPFTLPADSVALHLLQRIRDEAHRFAITGHRRRRARRFNESILEAVPGLGPTRRRGLLVHFGGLQGVLRASVQDLQLAPGIGAASAQLLYDHLHPGE
jgi:excinuclease ABC subunit C